MKKFREKFNRRNALLSLFVIGLFAFLAIGTATHSTGAGALSAVGSVAATGTVVLDPESEKKLINAAKQAAIDEFNAKAAAKLTELLDADSVLKEIKTLFASIKDAKTSEEIATLKQGLTELGEKINAAAEKAIQKEKSGESVIDRMVGAIKGGWDKIKGLKDTAGMEKFTFKTAGTMTISGNITPIGTNAIPFSATQWMPGYTEVVRRQPFIVQLCSLLRTVDMYIAWAEQRNTDPGAAATTAENSAKTQGDFDWVENNTKVEKITYFTKASKEILSDISLMEQAIRTEIQTVINLKLDSQVLSGNGSTPNLKGITSYAQAFSAPSSMANAVDYANNWDVLLAAITQIQTHGTSVGGELQGIFQPNYIVLNPIDVAILRSTKNQYQYLLPNWVADDANGLTVAGCKVIENVGMTAGKFLVGDFTKANVALREDAMIAVGYENDDFTKNLVTILGELRAASFVKTNHVNAFVYDSFSTALAALKDAKS